jgi:hypothetical protein
MKEKGEMANFCPWDEIDQRRVEMIAHGFQTEAQYDAWLAARATCRHCGETSDGMDRLAWDGELVPLCSHCIEPFVDAWDKAHDKKP